VSASKQQGDILGTIRDAQSAGGARPDGRLPRHGTRGAKRRTDVTIPAHLALTEPVDPVDSSSVERLHLRVTQDALLLAARHHAMRLFEVPVAGKKGYDDFEHRGIVKVRLGAGTFVVS
jgi:hypothetical protein